MLKQVRDETKLSSQACGQIPIPRSQGKCDRWRSPIFAGKSHIMSHLCCLKSIVLLGWWTVNMIESFFLVSFRFIMFIFNMFNHIWDDDWNGQGWLHQRVLHWPTNRTLLVYYPELAMEEHDSTVWTIPEGCWLRGILWVLETLLVLDFPIRKRYQFCCLLSAMFFLGLSVTLSR